MYADCIREAQKIGMVNHGIAVVQRDRMREDVLEVNTYRMMIRGERMMIPMGNQSHIPRTKTFKKYGKTIEMRRGWTMRRITTSKW